MQTLSAIIIVTKAFVTQDSGWMNRMHECKRTWINAWRNVICFCLIIEFFHSPYLSVGVHILLFFLVTFLHLYFSPGVKHVFFFFSFSHHHHFWRQLKTMIAMMRIWFRIEIGMSMMALTNEYWNKAKLSKQMKKKPNTWKSTERTKY